MEFSTRVDLVCFDFTAHGDSKVPTRLIFFNKLPNHNQPKAKQYIHDIWMAETRKNAILQGIPYDYVMAREHINSCNNLIALIPHYFSERQEA